MHDYKNKSFAQTFDGVVIMASDLNSLQSKTKSVTPHAIFTNRFAIA